MSRNEKASSDNLNTIGNVGANARVVQGNAISISWVEKNAHQVTNASLTEQFATLFERIARDGALDEDTKELAREKAKAVADGVEYAGSYPSRLRRALADAKLLVSSKAEWVTKNLGEILRGEAAQKTIGTITEAATKATIEATIESF